MKPVNEGERMHLDDDAFAELTLGGQPDAKVQAHLESCAACREELARFEESVESFNMASLAWSEEKSKALPALRPAGKAAASRTPRLAPGLSWALAALLALSVAVPVKMHFDATDDLHARNTILVDDDPSGLNSPEQIAKDNQLMAEVNYELTHSQEVLMTQYDRQRGARPGSGMSETGKRSR